MIDLRDTVSILGAWSTCDSQDLSSKALLEQTPVECSPSKWKEIYLETTQRQKQFFYHKNSRNTYRSIQRGH